MKVKASAGSDRRRDLGTYCHSLTLTAQTEEEAVWLCVVRRFVMGETDGMPCFPGRHRFVTRELGGSPDCAESRERVRVCEACGWEE